MMRTITLPIMSFMTRLLERIRGKVNQNNPFKYLLSILIIFTVASCAKDPGQIGYVIQPEDSKLNVAFNDSTSIYAYSRFSDSIQTSHMSLSALGSLNDPVFGNTVAGFYTQFVLSAPAHNFGEGKTLDSLVLQLRYADSYGDTNAIIYAHTYEMMESISRDSIYYSTLQLPIGSTDYSDQSFIPRFNDSIIVDGDTISSVIRLNLTGFDASLGEKLLNASEEDMESSENFKEFFNGLFIQSQPVNYDGGLIYFSLSSSDTKLTLYYSNDDDDSLSYDYIITTATANVSKYEHNRNNAEFSFREQVVNGDTILGQEKFYLQGFGGIETVIRMPHINKWAIRGNVAINEAKLLLPGYGDDNFFSPPTRLALYKIGADSSFYTLTDEFEGDTYFDGNYNSITNSYEFRITRYIQSLINDTTQPNNGLGLFVSGEPVNANRFIFKGNQFGSDTTGIKLEILFTDL